MADETDTLPAAAPHETLAQTVQRVLPHICTAGKGAAVVDDLRQALTREGVNEVNAPIYAKRAEEIRALIGQQRDSIAFDAHAIAGIARSWELTDPACQALALADAQVWATLHLAEVTQRVANQLDTLERIAQHLGERSG